MSFRKGRCGSVAELGNSLDCLAHLSSWLGADPTGNSTHSPVWGYRPDSEL